MLIIAEKEKVALNYIKALKLKKIETSLYANEEKTIKVTYAAGHLYTLYDAEDYDEKNKIWKTDDEKTNYSYPRREFFELVKKENLPVVINDDAHDPECLYDEHTKEAINIVNDLKLEVIKIIN